MLFSQKTFLSELELLKLKKLQTSNVYVFFQISERENKNASA
jgi:hypothetical protein